MNLHKIEKTEQILPFQHEYDKLEILISQGQFELILPTDEQRQDIRLVYLMNDAVESFLVFKNAKITGSYQAEFQGELWTYLEKDGQQYALVVHQGDSVCTLFFETLELEAHLFNHGKIGHFWVKGYEYLRQLEYKIAIIKDKLEYLGEAFCTKEEIELSHLAAFPPLNFCCYPAVSEKYVVPSYPRWQVSKEALQVMETLTAESNDSSLHFWIKCYRKCPEKIMAKWIAFLLHRDRHSKTIDALTKKLMIASSTYKDRIFTDMEEEKIRQLQKRAAARMQMLIQSGKQVEMLKEEPFLYVKDSVEYKIHLMIWKTEGKNRKVDIETFE